MTAFQVRLSGCDDTTDLVVDLTDDEAALLGRIAELSQQASSYGCQPRLIIEPPRTDEDDA